MGPQTNVGPAPVAPPPVVATPSENTLVTRRPRASHRPAEPHELLPTLRLPPVEARALRRQVAEASGETELTIDSGEIHIGDPLATASAAMQGATETPSVVVATPTEPAASTPTARPRTTPSTVTAPVATVPMLPTTPAPPTAGVRTLPGHSRLHRPPLPMPDVLRQGPRSAPRRAAEEPIAEAETSPAPVSVESTRVGFAPAPSPRPVDTIDTASLVLDLAETLTAEDVIEEDDDVPVDAGESPFDLDEPTRPVLAAPPAGSLASPFARPEVTEPALAPPIVSPFARLESTEPARPTPFVAPQVARLDAPRQRRVVPWILGVTVAAAAVGLGVWFGLPALQSRIDVVDAGLAATHEQSNAALEPAEPASLVAAAEPAPPVAAPALAPPPAAPTIAADTPTVAEDTPIVEDTPTIDANAPTEPAAPVPGTTPPVAAPAPDPAAAREAAESLSNAAASLLAFATPTEDDEAPTLDAAPSPAPSKPAKAAKSAKKSKSKSKAKPSKAPPPPPPAPKAPGKVASTGPALDAVALLREAEKAFAEGRHGTALRNAQRSLAARNDPRALRIVVLSACKLGRREVANSNFQKLPLGQRRSVRNTCKDAGVDVG